jgi:predicted amidohydrolase YtcJ
VRRGPGDAVVVPEDPLRVDPADLARLRPTLTVVAGRVVWRA